MGLISRVSSRTYRKSSKRQKKMVLSITNKLQKRAGARASDIENTVASAILDIQNNADPATKEQLMQLHVIAVKEMDVGGRNAIQSWCHHHRCQAGRKSRSRSCESSRRNSPANTSWLLVSEK